MAAALADKKGTVDSVDNSERVRRDSIRCKAQVLGAIPVAVGSFVIAAIHVGVVPALGIVIVTPLIVIAVIWALLRHDRNLRQAHLPDDVLATAGASAGVFQLRQFDQTMQLQAGPAALFGGDAEARMDSLVWRPLPRFRTLGAVDIVVPWTEVREMNCRRIGGLFRCDACHLSLHDGRDLIISITSPIQVERAMASIGVNVTGDTVHSSSNQ